MMKPVVPLDHARRTNWLMKQRNKKQAQVAAQAAHDQSAAAAGDQTKSEAAAEAAAKALKQRRTCISRLSPSRKRWMR
jgi:hypothetical protein